MIHISRKVELEVKVEDVLKRIPVERVVDFYGYADILRAIESKDPGTLLAFINPQSKDEA